ncbi:secreted RxLR effector protein 161-like [Thrips palmi]|uniref:Secreted RxLR effector protein 161-like n=1 Tax=Thrips palmi TaxID=161013 RepID=A0A6P8ZK14_THRPL|nr:secreted RxLR effector protein 161-like [Thrips palmi]
MADCNPMPTPLEISKHGYSQHQYSSQEIRNFPYTEVVGCLVYLSTKTRPDISFATNYVSRYRGNPKGEDLVNVKRILRYLQGTKNLGLLFPSTSSPGVVCYTDSDFAGSGPEFKMMSTSGYVIYVGGGPVVWLSKKQDVVATSVCEAEYIAAATCCKNLQYLKSFLYELICEQVPASVKIDNACALRLIKTGQMRTGTKHILVKFYFISEALRSGMFRISHCPSKDNIADIFTKPLLVNKFKYFCSKLVTSNL